MAVSIPWKAIDTVLLDMDGTLLDLHFDNYFWKEHLPRRYAEIKGLEPVAASEYVISRIGEIQGSLNWYCTDYWSETLQVDVIELKHEVSHKVAIRPYCIDFLDALRSANKDIVLVTNAHHDSLALKMEKTRLAHKFDRLITVHEFALPKEDPLCWREVDRLHPFDPAKTLLIDDNLHALTSAGEYGIDHLLAIYQPDSRAPRLEVGRFDAIHSFDEILPVVESSNE
jgi:HAD superfamily hydrolase (TIGR01509 family)